MSRARGARVRVRRLLVRRAHDVTDMVAGRSMLVIAPHPDDETLGCAGRIMRAVATGGDAWVVVVTDGAQSHDISEGDRTALRALRRSELKSACARLGVRPDRVIELDFADGALAECMEALTDDLVDLLRRLEPDDVYVTCGPEAHPDHAAAAQALSVAISRAAWAGRCLWYPIWLWSDWPLSRRHANGSSLMCALRTATFRHVELVRLDNEALQAKREALAAYGSQLGGLAPGGVSTALPEDVVGRALDGVELFFRVASDQGEIVRCASC